MKEASDLQLAPAAITAAKSSRNYCFPIDLAQNGRIVDIHSLLKPLFHSFLHSVIQCPMSSDNTVIEMWVGWGGGGYFGAMQSSLTFSEIYLFK